ncbi:tryptophan 2,3-dioxygenase [Herpetosiphon geysericola]|uniref:Tryptophan 2,3-dioxygenase n=1 Tax=Herpetosiphon geysericola TaxID=70996 RepID=A0A0P6YAY8_9CHLR|nr:tryptophan 2,3-dioxygenase family protein [Herpetosiphon geysericola]KPL90436.1 tryptophan 2,3-dioxygenase [Herpetosiphon geysericola]
MSQALTYASYLKIDELLNLQAPRSHGSNGPEHDELLFIVIHQVYELWFKQILHELDYLGELLRANDTGRANQTIRRILTILKTIVAQVDVMETMTPLQFNAFRGSLESASGFQSLQFREIEFALGHKRPAILQHFSALPSHERLEQRYQQASLWDSFLHYLQLNGYAIPQAQIERDVTQALAAAPEIQAILITVYRQNPLVSNLCERLIDLDEGFQEWRYRHVKMVERTIGIKQGTGGSSGAAYLASTIKPFFPDLWAIRADL